MTKHNRTFDVCATTRDLLLHYPASPAAGMALMAAFYATAASADIDSIDLRQLLVLNLITLTVDMALDGLTDEALDELADLVTSGVAAFKDPERQSAARDIAVDARALAGVAVDKEPAMQEPAQ